MITQLSGGMGIGKKTINKYVRIINIHKESCITNVHSSCPHSRRNKRNWVENLNNCASVFLIDLQSLTYFELYSFLALTVNYLLDGHIVRWNNYIISQWSRHYADEKVVMGNVVQQVLFLQFTNYYYEEDELHKFSDDVQVQKYRRRNDPLRNLICPIQGMNGHSPNTPPTPKQPNLPTEIVLHFQSKLDCIKRHNSYTSIHWKNTLTK